MLVRDLTDVLVDYFSENGLRERYCSGSRELILFELKSLNAAFTWLFHQLYTRGRSLIAVTSQEGVIRTNIQARNEAKL